jgi:hypothetical protein
LSLDPNTRRSQPTASSHELSRQLKEGLRLGGHKGLKGFVWITKILVPVSLAVALLDWTGWLYVLDPFFQPVMGLMNLPPQAALPIITAIFTSFYAALGMIVVIPFTEAQVTLLAIFITICHMLVVESTIQHKAGFSFVQTSILRLVTAGVTVFVVSLFFTGTETPVVMPDSLGAAAPLSDMLTSWAISTLSLLLKIAIIIGCVMIAIETMKVLGWTERLARIFRPLMALLGLSPNVAPMWVAGALFGIIYGSAAISEEAASGRYSPDELKRLHMHLGINHSTIEDPALFLALGISVFWTMVPRLLAAAAVVNIYNVACKIWSRVRPKPAETVA